MEHIISVITESIVKSSITLATRRIEEIGQYLYFRFLRKKLIPEDMCAELYEAVVTHLKKYRENNPEVKKVKRAFVTTCANWIVCKLRKKEKKQETQESVVYELVKNELKFLNEPDPGKLNKQYEKRIINIIRDLVSRRNTESGKIKNSKIKKRHILFYVLFHAYSSRLGFSVKILKTSGLKTSENIRRLKRIRRNVEQKSLKRRNKLLNNIENKYASVIKTQYEIKALSDTQLSEEKALKKSELKQINKERKETITELSSIRVVPSIKFLADMLKLPWSTVESGINRAEELIMEAIKNPEKEEVE